MSRRLPITVALTAISFSVASASLSAEITAERTEKGAVVKIDGQLFTEYLVQSGNKPILWPIIGPTGKPMTRDYPMRDRPGETKDHPHHRSLWFTYGNVGGVDFWADEPGAGTIKHLEFTKVAGGKPAVIATRNAWLAPDGRKICEDRRVLRFDTDGDARWIDFDIAIEATDGPVDFGDTKEGAFGVRVAESLRVDAHRGGQIVNSRGQADAATWGQPAEWVDYHGPINGQTVGIAILNHPTSFHFPTRWHVRTYGLFAANPFGTHEYDGGKPGGVACTLPAGQSATLRYRVLLHRDNQVAGKVAEAFSTYAKEIR
jgi:hypothetical protein